VVPSALPTILPTVAIPCRDIPLLKSGHLPALPPLFRDGFQPRLPHLICIGPLVSPTGSVARASPLPTLPSLPLGNEEVAAVRHALNRAAVAFGSVPPPGHGRHSAVPGSTLATSLHCGRRSRPSTHRGYDSRLRRLPAEASRSKWGLPASNVAMDRLWLCIACDGACMRSYDAIVANGEPSCPFCGDNMRLTRVSGRDFDLLSRPIRL
jgi:hypothetical protein